MDIINNMAEKKKETKTEIIAKNADLELVQKQLVRNFEQEFPSYIKKAQRKFRRDIDRLCDDAREIEVPESYSGRNKINTIGIENYLCNTITRYGGKPKYNATSMSLASDFFWQTINQINEKGIYFVPTIELFCNMIGISTQTFKSYVNDVDENMRNAIEIMQDRFKGYYIQRGMTRELDNQMTIFNLRANFGMKDTEAPVNIGTAIFAPVDKDYERRVQEKHGFVVQEIDFSVEE